MLQTGRTSSLVHANLTLDMITVGVYFSCNSEYIIYCIHWSLIYQIHKWKFYYHTTWSTEPHVAALSDCRSFTEYPRLHCSQRKDSSHVEHAGRQTTNMHVVMGDLYLIYMLFIWLSKKTMGNLWLHSEGVRMFSRTFVWPFSECMSRCYSKHDTRL